MNKKLDLDSFGDMVDKFLEENEIEMLLTMPKGTLAVQVKDNTMLGATIQLYIMLQGITPICKEMQNQLGIDAMSPERKELVCSILDLFACNMLEYDDA